MIDLLKQMIEVQACPGREHGLAKKIIEIIKPYVDDVKVDRLGSVIAKINGQGKDKKKILFTAHMDEVGLIVTSIDGRGYVRITNDGGPNVESLLYREIVFESGIHGVVVPMSGGAQSYSSIVADIGAKDREEALKYVKVGDVASAIPTMTQMVGTCYCGRPVDDRIGCAILLKTAMELKKPYHDIYLAFSVQEEVALPDAGGSVIGFEIQPDICLSVDVGATGDAYSSAPIETKIGGGASILLYDPTYIPDKGLVDHLVKIAEKNNIKYQIEVSLSGGTDSVPIQKVGLGCKASEIAIPMRYLHTSAETFDMLDAKACLDLIVATCYEDTKDLFK